jgi:hypothetical protein
MYLCAAFVECPITHVPALSVAYDLKYVHRIKILSRTLIIAYFSNILLYISVHILIEVITKKDDKFYSCYFIAGRTKSNAQNNSNSSEYKYYDVDNSTANQILVST